jgi:hypothetical protein
MVGIFITTPPFPGKKDSPNSSASKDKVSGIKPAKPRVPIEVGVPDVDKELVGPPEDDPLAYPYSSESIDKQIDEIAAMENPCNAVGEFFEELSDQIDELSEQFDELVDLLVDKISNFLGIPAIVVKWVVDYALFRAGLKKDFQSEDVFKEIQAMGAGVGEGEGTGGEPSVGGGPSFTDELKALYKLGVDSYNFQKEVKRMQKKWGGFDPSLDQILANPSGFIRALGSDFERLCNMIPKYEADKKGGVKVTSEQFGLGFPIPLKEILEEGASPWITKLLDALEDLDFSGLEAHEHYDKIKDEADDKCSCGDL